MSERFNSLEQSRESTIIELGESLESKLDEAERLRIKIEDFKGLGIFTDEEIDRDIKYVLDRINSFKLSAQRMTDIERKIHDEAKIIETLLPFIIHDYKWLGDVEMLFASTYDDLHNGIDSVAQIKGPGGRNFGFEIDFTTSQQAMLEKIRKSGELLKAKGPNKVKYFDSAETGKIGNVQMPRIVFGDSNAILSDFASIAAEAYTDSKNEAARKELANHKLRKHFIEAVKYQLNVNGNSAKSLGHAEFGRQHADLLKYIIDNKL